VGLIADLLNGNAMCPAPFFPDSWEAVPLSPFSVLQDAVVFDAAIRNVEHMTLADALVA